MYRRLTFFRNGPLRAVTLHRPTRTRQISRIRHLLECHSRAISGSLLVINGPLFNNSIIRFTMGQRALNLQLRVMIQRRRLRVQLSMTILRVIMRVILLINGRFKRLLFTRFYRDLIRSFLVDLMARINGRATLFHSRCVSHATCIRVLRHGTRS